MKHNVVRAHTHEKYESGGGVYCRKYHLFHLIFSCEAVHCC